MKTYKVYIRLNGQLDQVFIGAVSKVHALANMLTRSPKASIVKVVEVA